MARKTRQFEVGGIYHIVKRGVEKRKIFLKTQDYHRFIFGLEFFNTEDSTNIWELVSRKSTDGFIRESLEKERQKQKKPIVELLLFALMPNHFHLILREITEGGISKYMQKLGGYATYFNEQYDRVGALFQGRYKAVPIVTSEQLIAVFAYVHTNPIELIEPGWKEFKVQDPEHALDWLKDYRWSSYRDYIGIENFPTTTQRQFFLKFFGSEEKNHNTIKDWVKFKAKRTVLGTEIVE